ncbi:MAG: helix-turn-helix transcriptional regulator [Sedimentisphaerales bacterium]|nr:helix-turn-helix transcriptional regulator [Sedimentisphaerales bacterium]
MDEETDNLARWLKVLSVGARLRIIQLLNGRSLCVNALAHQLDITQSAVSQHLRVLREAGLVMDEKRGYYVHYRLNEEALSKCKEAINHVLEVKLDNYPVKKGRQKCVAAKKTKKAVRNRRT